MRAKDAALLATVVINNYNYARYLPDAIGSALGQTYEKIEVVVVDDGSTDDSRAVIESYGDGVIPVLKENGGQGSAFNSGFETSRGEIVCFLDSDDIFRPEKIATVVSAFRENPAASLVYHPLQPVDAEQKHVGKPYPRGVVTGDIRTRVERSGGWWPKASTSGLSCSRAFLQRVLPMPREPFRRAADGWIVGLAPFFGPVVGVPSPLGWYRLHGRNRSRRPTKKEQNRDKLDRLVTEFDAVSDALANRFHIPASLSLEDNFRYHQLRWATGQRSSLLRAITLAARNPSLPLTSRPTEIARMVLKTR